MTIAGRMKVDMNKVESEENTTFTNSSLPALERNVEVLISLLSHLHINVKNSSTSGLESPKR